jgi:hypothetical protein
MYGPEAKLGVPYQPYNWEAFANDIFNLEGGKNRSIKEEDTDAIRQDLPGAWRRAKTSGLENYVGPPLHEYGGQECSDLADNYVKT